MRGLRGLAGLRADAPSEARGAGGQVLRRPEIWRGSGGGRRSGGAAAVVADLAGLWQAGDLAGLRSTLENKGGVAPRIRKTGDL